MAVEGEPMDPATPLPTGTVTFPFTDIEGSVRLWEQQPEAIREAIAAPLPAGERAERERQVVVRGAALGERAAAAARAEARAMALGRAVARALEAEDSAPGHETGRCRHTQEEG
jgi:hypothetical protein